MTNRIESATVYLAVFLIGVFSHALFLRHVTTEAPVVEVEVREEIQLGGYAHPHGARLAFNSMGYAGDCRLVEAVALGEGRFVLQAVCE